MISAVTYIKIAFHGSVKVNRLLAIAAACCPYRVWNPWARYRPYQSERARAVADEIRELGKGALDVVCDIGDEEQVKGMVDKLAELLLLPRMKEGC